MLNRSYYDDNFAYELMEMYTALDTSIIEAMARRIVRMGRVSDYTRWQAEILQEAGLLYEDVIRLIGEQTGMSDEHLQQIFEDAAVESVSFDNTIYEAAGLEIVPLRQSPSMMNLLRAGLKKTGGSLRNLTMTTANTAQTAYISACNLAYMQVSSGAMSYTEAIRAAVKSSAKQGTKVLYPSGHQDQLDVAIRRSVLTGVSQTSAVIGMENARLMGCDLMEITAHAGARPEHAAWQGKIVSLSGRKGYLTLADIGYGSVTGFKGANCRHDWYPFFEGISTRLYSDSQLEELAKSDLYDLQQGQRAMERQIRATRRELAGYDAAMSAADPDTAAAIRNDFDEAAVKLKKQEAALREYCRSNGLLEDSSRVQTLYGDGTTQGFGRSTSQKAVWANRKALKTDSNSGIINTGAISGALNPVSPQAEQHAKRYYEFIRKTKSDISKISAHTGISADKIEKIKNHIFVSEHILDDGVRRFDPSYSMAVSWQRLMNGEYIERDIVLLKHEYAELRYMERGLSQAEAHVKASKRYNYAKYLD